MIKYFIIFSLVFFVATTCFLYVWQRHIIYFPDETKPQPHMYQADDMHVIPLNTADNVHIYAWYKRANPGQPTVLYLHGNAGHIGIRMPLCRTFIDAGFGVFLLEYRGYGGNKGEPTEKGLYQDARAAVQYLKSIGVDTESIVLYGESLGTAVATKIATEELFCMVVLQSPFTSLRALAKYHYPWVFIEPWDKFDSYERISALNTSLLILLGTDDKVVPLNQGLSLFEKANEPKKMLTFSQRNHHNLWDDPEYATLVINYVKTHCVQ